MHWNQCVVTLFHRLVVRATLIFLVASVPLWSAAPNGHTNEQSEIAVVIQPTHSPTTTRAEEIWAVVRSRNISETAFSGEFTCMIGKTCTIQAQPNDLFLALDISAPGYWREEHIIEIAGQAPEEPRRVLLKRVGRIQGRILAGQPKPPEEVELFFWEAGSLPGSPEFGNSATLVPTEDGNFSTEIPEGTHDLKLRAKGFASHFFWKQNSVATKILDVGDIRLRQGASVVGWIVSDNPELKLPDSTVRLIPISGNPLDRESTRQNNVASENTKPNEKGFFSLEAIRPGLYTVEATGSDGSTATFEPLTVYPNRESLILNPLLLQPPAVLEVVVTPPQTPQGGEWTVMLMKTTSSPGFRSLIGKSETDGGLTRFEDLRQGTYIATVMAGESAYRSENIEISAPWEFLEISTEGVPVWGHLFLNDEPLEAEIYFGKRADETSVRSDSDSEGRFSCILPHSGRWPLEVFSYTDSIQSSFHVVVPSKMGENGVEIHVPNGFIRGHVEDQHSNPVGGAYVSAVQLGETMTVARTRCNDDGEFVFRGLQGSKVRLEAESRGKVSDPMEVSLRPEQKDQTDHLLVLRPGRVLSGRVLSPTGAVFGCIVTVSAVGEPMASMAKATTDFEGRFEIRLPGSPSARNAIVTLLPPGYVLDSRVVNIPDEGEIEIRTSSHGGTLSVDVSALMSPDNNRIPFLTFNGLPISFVSLSEWSHILGTPWRGENPVLTLSNMAPGTWTLCAAAADEATQMLASGGAGCSSGLLNPGGSLNLKVP